MGTRGPQKTPTHILQLRGSHRGNRPLEPQPDRIAPRRPNGLSTPVKAVWKRVIGHLEDMGTLAVSDGAALERYCRLFVEWRKMQAFIDTAGHAYALYLTDKDGQYILDPNGQKVLRCRIQHPEVGVRNKLNVDLLRIEQQFGLSPAARASLLVTEPVKGVTTVRTRKRVAE